MTSTGIPLSQVGAGPGNESRRQWPGSRGGAGRLCGSERADRTVAEERLLGRIAEDAGAAQGWAIVAAAIYEAVDSGSAFVAPKRVREIVRRWLRDGLPAELSGSDESGSTPIESLAPVETIDRDEADPGEVRPFWVAEAGIGSAQLWAAVIDLIAQQGAARPAEIHDYLKPAVLVNGPVRLRSVSASRTSSLANGSSAAGGPPSKTPLPNSSAVPNGTSISRSSAKRPANPPRSEWPENRLDYRSYSVGTAPGIYPRAPPNDRLTMPRRVWAWFPSSDPVDAGFGLATGGRCYVSVCSVAGHNPGYSHSPPQRARLPI